MTNEVTGVFSILAKISEYTLKQTEDRSKEAVVDKLKFKATI